MWEFVTYFTVPDITLMVSSLKMSFILMCSTVIINLIKSKFY